MSLYPGDVNRCPTAEWVKDRVISRHVTLMWEDVWHFDKHTSTSMVLINTMVLINLETLLVLFWDSNPNSQVSGTSKRRSANSGAFAEWTLYPQNTQNQSNPDTGYYSTKLLTLSPAILHWAVPQLVPFSTIVVFKLRTHISVLHLLQKNLIKNPVWLTKEYISPDVKPSISYAWVYHKCHGRQSRTVYI